MESTEKGIGFGRSRWWDSRSQRAWVVKVVLILSALFWLGLISLAWNEANAAATDDDSPELSGVGIESKDSPGSDYNFSWLDPDKKVYVLQNRKFLKAKHFIFSVTGGLAPSPFRNVI